MHDRLRTTLLSLLAVSFFSPTTASALLDSNNNNVSDVWEAVYGPITNWDEDVDGDGFTHREEANAGTDPYDSKSFPNTGELKPLPDNVWLNRLPTVRGVQYQAYISGNMIDWYPVLDPLNGTGKIEEVKIDLDREFVRGGALRARWDDVSDTVYLVTLIDFAVKGTPPTSETRLNWLDLPYPVPHQLNYGQWIRGWIIPPQAGIYTFWLAVNDIGQFYLSSSSSASDKQLTIFPESWAYYQEWEKFPSQRSTPVFLQEARSYYFELYHRQWTGQSNLSLAWTRPDRPEGEKEIIGGSYLSSTGQSLTTLIANAGGQFFLRWETNHIDSDGDGVSDFGEYLLGLDPLRASTFARLSDVEYAKERLTQSNVITASVAAARAYEAENESALIVVTRTGGISPITVHLNISGTAEAGVDYVALTDHVIIPAGGKEAVIEIKPIKDDVPELRKNVTVSLIAGTGYSLGTNTEATVYIEDAKDVLYIAQLRSAPTSIAGGTGQAVLRRSGNGLTTKIRFSYQALSGLEPKGEVVISEPNKNETLVRSVDLRQANEVHWDYRTRTSPDSKTIHEAIESNRLCARIVTSKGIELVGKFVPAEGNSVMPIPPDPPSAPNAPDSLGEAARFLIQATFGPTPETLSELTHLTYKEWLDHQFSLPPSFHFPYFEQRHAEILAQGSGGSTARLEAWWQHALTAPDQLRQRMAFALSQIFVMSQVSSAGSYQYGSTRYYDLLIQHAFGNFRELLEVITLDPMMGLFLGMQRNKKADYEKGIEPDENFAREVMQLFTLGLNLLHDDGSLVLDNSGFPVSTYTQKDVSELASVFTGWGPHWDDAKPPQWSDGRLAVRHAWYEYGVDEYRPMSFYPEYHDTENRIIVGGNFIPAGIDGQARLRKALDALFMHPNVGPFIARQLIQKFVTSNPSPGYVYRVSSVFNNNGQGIRGDLKSVIKAILLDSEARNLSFRNSNYYGKPSEPLLRVTRLYRALPAPPPLAELSDPMYYLNLTWEIPEQRPLLAPSVFNFFRPDYSQSGIISEMGLFSPEFQILTESTAITQANSLYNSINFGTWAFKVNPLNNQAVYVKPDFAHLVSILNSRPDNYKEAQSYLIDYLNGILLCGFMSEQLRADIQSAFDALPTWFRHEDTRQTLRAQMAVYLIVTSPEFFVQR